MENSYERILKQFGCQRKGWGVGDGQEQKGEETHTYRIHIPELTETRETLISLGRRGTLVGWPVRVGGQHQSKRTQEWCGTNPGGQPCPLRRVLISPAAGITLQSQEKLSEMFSGHVLHGPHRPPRLQWPTAVPQQCCRSATSPPVQEGPEAGRPDPQLHHKFRCGGLQKVSGMKVYRIMVSVTLNSRLVGGGHQFFLLGSD